MARPLPELQFLAFASAARDHLLDGGKPSPIAVLRAPCPVDGHGRVSRVERE